MQDTQAAPTAEFESEKISAPRARLAAIANKGNQTMPIAPPTVPLASGPETVPLLQQTAPMPTSIATAPMGQGDATIEFTPPTPPTMPFAANPLNQDATVPFSGAQPPTAQFAVPAATVPGETGGLTQPPI